MRGPVFARPQKKSLGRHMPFIQLSDPPSCSPAQEQMRTRNLPGGTEEPADRGRPRSKVTLKGEHREAQPMVPRSRDTFQSQDRHMLAAARAAHVPTKPPGSHRHLLSYTERVRRKLDLAPHQEGANTN